MAILTCKQTCECISLQIFSKYPIKKSRDRTNPPPPPDLPTLKAYPTPGVGGRFGIFSLKWRERMNLKVPGAILPLGCAILSTRAKTVRGVGTTPLRRTRVKQFKWTIASGNLLLKNMDDRYQYADHLCTYCTNLYRWCFSVTVAFMGIIILGVNPRHSGKVPWWMGVQTACTQKLSDFYHIGVTVQPQRPPFFLLFYLCLNLFFCVKLVLQK